MEFEGAPLGFLAGAVDVHARATLLLLVRPRIGIVGAAPAFGYSIASFPPLGLLGCFHRGNVVAAILRSGRIGRRRRRRRRRGFLRANFFGEGYLELRRRVFDLMQIYPRHEAIQDDFIVHGVRRHHHLVGVEPIAYEQSPVGDGLRFDVLLLVVVEGEFELGGSFRGPVLGAIDGHSLAIFILFVRARLGILGPAPSFSFGGAGRHVLI
mmetsp:Transcript_18649/g.39081  ORF Transcript_18649/g.39081 Transcript_18649/m.39081 type:complete len:210 (-) Transcript_18649:60-689(-)